MITLEHYILEVALLLVLAYSTWRHDRRDGPLTLLWAYILTMDFCIRGFKEVWYQVYRRSLILRYGLGWAIDVFFVSGFAAHWVVAFRYRRDRWPARLALKACVLAGGLLLVTGIHAVQRLYLDLGPWDIGLRWVVLNLSCLASAVLAGWHLAQVFRLKEVAPAHLVLGVSVVIIIVQFLLALRPWAWDMSLYRLANLVADMVILLVYAVRLGRSSFRPGRSGHRR